MQNATPEVLASVHHGGWIEAWLAPLGEIDQRAGLAPRNIEKQQSERRMDDYYLSETAHWCAALGFMTKEGIGVAHARVLQRGNVP